MDGAITSMCYKKNPIKAKWRWMCIALWGECCAGFNLTPKQVMVMSGEAFSGYGFYGDGSPLADWPRVSPSPAQGVMWQIGDYPSRKKIILFYWLQCACRGMFLFYNRGQDIFIASKASGCHLDTQTLKNHPSGHPKMFASNFIKCHFQTYNFFSLQYFSHDIV